MTAAPGVAGPPGAGRALDGAFLADSWGVLHADDLMHPVDVSDWPVKLDSHRQLLLDDYLIASREGVRRVLHQPCKHPANPIMTGETAVEGGPRYGPVLAYILRDGATGRFRHWYRSRISYRSDGRSYSFPNLYAESEDGIHWQRPRLGLYEFEGSRDNNIILPAGDLRGLIYEPQDASAPWKAIWEHNSPSRCPEGIDRQGCYLYTSADGLRWRPAQLAIPYGPRRSAGTSGDHPFPLPRLGDTNHVRWDPRLKTYVCDAKGTVPARDGGAVPTAGVPGGDGHHRFRLQMESDDLVHWSRPRVVAFPDRLDFERGTIGFYGLLGTTYEGMWIGYLRAHRLDPWKRVDVQLVTSHDGRTWSRACDREAFLPLGPEGSWEPDYSEINHAGPLLVGDELWFFYRGSILESHRGSGPDLRKGLGLATLRRDGFASLSAGAAGGTVTTRPLTFAGRRLFVNATTQGGGHLRVEVLTRDGVPVEGYGAGDSQTLPGPETATPVRWASGEIGDLPAGGTPQPLRLRFHLRSADLYAFWIA
jgi:hypothetical protein